MYFGFVAQCGGHQPSITRRKQQRMHAPVDCHPRQLDKIGLAHRLANECEGFLRYFVLRHLIKRLIEIDAIDLRQYRGLLILYHSTVAAAGALIGDKRLKSPDITNCSAVSARATFRNERCPPTRLSRLSGRRKAAKLSTKNTGTWITFAPCLDGCACDIIFSIAFMPGVPPCRVSQSDSLRL